MIRYFIESSHVKPFCPSNGFETLQAAREGYNLTKQESEQYKRERNREGDSYWDIVELVQVKRTLGGASIVRKSIYSKNIEC